MPTLTVIIGDQATGKTIIARALAAITPSVTLDSSEHSGRQQPSPARIRTRLAQGKNVIAILPKRNTTICKMADYTITCKKAKR